MSREGLTVSVHQILIRAVPDVLSNWAALVEIHAHPLFLRSLASEDVRSDGLLNLRLAEEHLVFGLLVDGLDLDDLAAGDHANMLQLHADIIVGENHAGE